jgi:PKD-like domain
MKDTPTIAGKVPKFAPILILITNQNFYTTIPMIRSSNFWRLAVCLFIAFLGAFTPTITAKTTVKTRLRSTNLADISLYASKKTATVGDFVDIEITTGGLSNVEEMTIPIIWNTDFLTYQSVKDLSTDIPSFTTANFNTSNTTTGSLLLNWAGVPSSIADGERFFTVTFKVRAYTGIPASVVFNTLGSDGLSIKTIGNTSATVALNNGSVKILDANPCPPRVAGLSCQTTLILNATEFPYYSTLPATNIQPPLTGNVCTSPIDNSNWVAFIAASTALTLKVSAANCNIGIHYFIYETTDCVTFQKVVCRQGAIPGGTDNTESLTGLTIGKQYYIMIDGYNGDQCGYRIDILSGQVKNYVQDIPNQTVSGPSLACDKPTGLTFSIPIVPNADKYIWRVPPTAIITTPVGSILNEIKVNWGTVSDSVCVRIASRCDTTKWYCKSVKAGATIRKDTTVRKCTLEPYLFDGVNRFEAKQYIGNFIASTGCDSIVTLNLVNIPSIVKDTIVFKCFNDPFKFNNVDLRAEGNYSIIHCRQKRLIPPFVRVLLLLLVVEIFSPLTIRLLLLQRVLFKVVIPSLI